MQTKTKHRRKSGVVPSFGIMLLLCLLAGVMFNSGVVFAQDDLQDTYEPTPFDSGQEYEDLVLAVLADRMKLSEGIFALERNGVYYLPVKALSSVFNFYLEEQTDPFVLSGYAISEEESFSIDLNNKVVVYKGRSAPINDIAYVDPSITSEDIYLASDALSQIWPMKLDIDLGSLLLRVDPDQKLPFQLALERERRQKNFKNKRQEKIDFIRNVDELPFVAKPYELWSLPAIDIDTQAGFDARNDGMEYRTSLTGVQDLGFASADYSASYGYRNGSLDKPDNIRLRFRRQNIYPNALPLDLEDTQWGDVRLRNRDLISAGSNGRGFIFTNDTNNFETEFDEITVDGVSRPGWEVELYINDELIDFGVVDSSGEYRFEDVVVTYGNNEVKVVLYGPQGQLEERIENYFYQSNIAKEGEFVYSGGFVDAQRDLIKIDPNKSSLPKGLAANFQGAYGIAKGLTSFFSLNTIKDRDTSGFGFEEVRRDFVTAGATGSFNSTLAQAEIYKEIGGGEAADLKTLSDFKGFKINTQTAVYHDFESPDARSGTGRKKLEFDFNVRKLLKTAIGSLGFDVGGNYLRRENGTSTKNLITRQSLGVNGARITNTTRTNLSNNKHSTSTGRLSATARSGSWRFRNSFNYNFFPETQGTSIQAEARYGTRRDMSYAFSVQKNFQTQEEIVGFQLTKDFQKFLGSFESDWSSRDGISFLLRASTAFGPYADDGGYIMQSNPLRSAGPVKALVYVDKDYDAEFSDGDYIVPGTKIQVGPRYGREETNQNGYVTEINTSSGKRLGVAISKKTIDDPYLIPGNEGFSVYPRPGVTQYVELPLVETGAIDGTLVDGNGKPIPGLTLQIMNADAEIVQSSQTGIDGYFTFERIPPDSYTIRAAPDSGLNIPFKYIDLTPDNLFQFGIQITAIDLFQSGGGDIETAVGDDGALTVKNILSIAKGFKENSRFIRASAGNVVQQTGNTALPDQKVSSVSGSRQIRAVRVGKHSNKVRIVMDLTAPIEYVVKQNKQSSEIIVDMPNTGWTATPEYTGDATSRLKSYHIEALEGGGTRLVLQAAPAAVIGDYGLLKPYKGKKDRFYLDIK